MEPLHAWTPCERRRQRQALLALAAATLGLLIGMGAGAAAAQDGPAARAVLAAGTDPTATEVVVDTGPSLPAEPGETPTGADPEWQPGSVEPGSVPVFPLLVKVCLGLGLVVLLAWGTVYLLRRSALGAGLTNQGSAVQVLDRNWLGPNKAIFLVDIGGRTLAVGVTEQQISLLSSWEPGEIEVVRPPGTGPRAFATQFRALLGRGRASAARTGSRARGEAAARGAVVPGAGT